MSPNIIWLLPPAGILLGFAASLAFIRLKPLSAAGYSRNSYPAWEAADLKLGLLAAALALALAILSAGGYSHYRSLNLSRSLADLTDHGRTRIIDIRDIGLPNTIDDRRLNREPFSAAVAQTPTYGIPKPVDADPVDDGGPMTQAELGASLSSLASVNPDSLRGPVDLAGDDLVPEREGFVDLGRQPELLRAVRPVYPAICISAGFEGRVYLNLLLDLDGRIKLAEVAKSSGNQALDEAALDAARQFLFSPALSPEGKPVRVWVAYPITFSLSNH
jgi:TonB family protein